MLVNSEMYEGSACYDPTIHGHATTHLLIDHQDEIFSQTHLPNLHQTTMDPPPNHLLNITMDMDHHPTAWSHDLIDMVGGGGGDQTGATLPTPTPPDLLNLFHLPRCTNSSISFSNPTHIDQASGQLMYDPLLPLNLPPQPPFFRELLHSLPGGASVFGEMDMEREGVHHHQLYHEGDGVLKFSGDMNGIVGKGRDGKDTKHFATEKHRRQQLNDKFEALKGLVPNPTKADRASVVGDAIEYINELKRTVEELKILVERKRCSRSRMKKHKTTELDDSTLDFESISTKPADQAAAHDHHHPPAASALRSSWLQRKSKNTEVDVRIIDDEVTIKLVQQKRINCLLFVSKVLDELQLDLHHVAGGLIGDFYSYLFNTKICEGSSVYASAIANKLIEVVDRQYASIPATTSY